MFELICECERLSVCMRERRERGENPKGETFMGGKNFFLL